MKSIIALYGFRMNQNTLLQYIIVSFFCIYGFLIASCSGADPVIYDLQWDLQSFKDNTTNDIYERLILHVLTDDEDGFDEIYELYVINDASERYWRITQDEWKLLTIDNLDWIAINSIVSNQYEKLPRGEYRVLVLDYSGFRDEKNFFITYNYSQEEQFFNNENNNTLVFDPIPVNIFPKLRQFSNNTYLPLLETRFLTTTDGALGDLFMQLVYPLPKKDLAGNILMNNYRELILSLGENGTIYKIEPNKVVSFLPDFANIDVINPTFLVYLHYRLEEVITVSSGPFTIEINRNTDIYENSVEDIVNVYR